ncbi:hypothetical protein C4564_06350 [Candidatus Microgenomates bacterium]|nr:MAG: hypothetical protein C4564_06350 [Candidatus Microgenomates bacterium]
MNEQINSNIPNTPNENPIITPPPVAENAQNQVPVLPADSPTPADINAKPKSKKKTVFIAAVILVLTLIAAVIAYKQLQNIYIRKLDPGMILPSASPTPEATADDTMANWETYTGPGYSFKHPPVFESPVETEEGGWTGASMVMFGETQKASGRTQTELFDGLVIRTLINTSEYTSAKDAADAYHQADDNSTRTISSSVSEIQEITVGGKTAYYYEVHGFGDARMYFIDLGSSVLRATILYAGAEEDVKNFLSLADKIISTFEFTNTTTTPAGQQSTYTNTKYTYSFEYPTEYDDINSNCTVATFSDDLVSLHGCDSLVIQIKAIDTLEVNPDDWWNEQKVESYTNKPTSCFAKSSGVKLHSLYNPLKTIATLPAGTILLDNVSSTNPECTEPPQVNMIIVPHNNKLLQITYDYASLSEQILSTFKFTK